MFTELLTERLRLRPIIERDLDSIFEKWAQDREISKYTTWKSHRDIQETKQFINSSLKQWSENSYTWIIEEKKSKNIVGSFAARKNNHKIDIGYLIEKGQWGKGYMTEVIKSFISEVFKNDNIERVWAVCDKDNLASKRVMEKAGMKYEGLLKSWLVRPNMSSKARDCHCLGITKETYNN